MNSELMLLLLLLLQEEGEDVEEKDPKERSKLHRRDTPHYLKNKRIHEPIDKEKAMALIASALKKQELNSSHLHQSTNQSEDEEEEEEEQAVDDDRLPTPPPPPALRNEVVDHIHRSIHSLLSTFISSVHCVF